MKLTDSEIEEIATKACSATGLRKKQLAQEVLELRQANARLQSMARTTIAQTRQSAAVARCGELEAEKASLQEKIESYSTALEAAKAAHFREQDDARKIVAENTRLAEELKEAKDEALLLQEQMLADHGRADRALNTPLREERDALAECLNMAVQGLEEASRALKLRDRKRGAPMLRGEAAANVDGFLRTIGNLRPRPSPASDKKSFRNLPPEPSNAD